MDYALTAAVGDGKAFQHAVALVGIEGIRDGLADIDVIEAQVLKGNAVLLRAEDYRLAAAGGKVHREGVFAGDGAVDYLVGIWIVLPGGVRGVGIDDSLVDGSGPEEVQGLDNITGGIVCRRSVEVFVSCAPDDGDR